MTYAVASSAGWPGRFIGTCLPKLATASGGKVEGMSGVQIGPGATEFARIPRLTSNCARPAVKFWIAPLKPGSAIINTASINSDAPSPHLLAYDSYSIIATLTRPLQNITVLPRADCDSF